MKKIFVCLSLFLSISAFAGSGTSAMIKIEIENYLSTGVMSFILENEVRELQQENKLLSDEEAVLLLLERIEE